MEKAEAIALLGGSAKEAARLVGVSMSAIGQWPDTLPRTISDRVLAALWRVEQGIEPPAPEKKQNKGAEQQQAA